MDDTETITIVDAAGGTEYVVKVSAENAAKAQTDAVFAERLLKDLRQTQINSTQGNNSSAEDKVTAVDSTGGKWTTNAVHTLMREYKITWDDMKSQQQARDYSFASKGWKLLADKMSDIGFICTPVQVKNKVNTMMNVYKRWSRRGSNPKNWPYLEVSTKQLQRLWSNMKSNARNAKTAENQRHYTGGGETVPDMDTLDARVLNIDKTILKPIDEVLDCDNLQPETSELIREDYPVPEPSLSCCQLQQAVTKTCIKCQLMKELFDNEVDMSSQEDATIQNETYNADDDQVQGPSPAKKAKGPKNHDEPCMEKLREREARHLERMEFKQGLLENLKQLPYQKSRGLLKMSMSEVLEQVAAIIDSSSDESDCQCPRGDISLPRRQRHRESPYMDIQLPSLSEAEFKQQFRISRSTFEYIMKLIGPTLLRVNVNPSVQVLPTDYERKQVLVTLWIISNPEPYRMVAKKFDAGTGSCIVYVRRVTRALLKFSTQFIQWPTNFTQVAIGFKKLSGVPDVVGALASTYIAIPVLRSNKELYNNKRGKPSILLQVVCDDKMRFTHCYAGHVGSASEYSAFRSSMVYDFLGKEERFPNDSHIVGNSSYTLHSNLMVPYTEDGRLSFRQKNYNHCLEEAYSVGARALGLLKNRFAKLLVKLPITRLDLVPQFVTACCVLHNICLFENDLFPELAQVLDEETLPQTQSMRASGFEKRNKLAARLPVKINAY